MGFARQWKWKTIVINIKCADTKTRISPTEFLNPTYFDSLQVFENKKWVRTTAYYPVLNDMFEKFH